MPSESLVTIVLSTAINVNVIKSYCLWRYLFLPVRQIITKAAIGIMVNTKEK